MNALLAPSSSRSGNLPAELSSFVGREADLSSLYDVQARAPLLTLVGPGGVGKTRLALRLAAVLSGSYPDGTWLVDVAPLAEPSHVAQAVANVLGVREKAGQPWLSALAHRLRARQLLLILDNCERLVASCAELAEALRRAVPGLHILATSRQPLETCSEHLWRVQPLSLPGSATIQRNQLLANEAVSLFVARARSRVPDFRPTDHSLGVIAEICRRLDGLPLAVELVAERVGSFDLAEIATRLETGLRLRITGHPTAPARQQTLRATLDWSYTMLSLDEALLLRRLAVFTCGWTAEAAQAVCADVALPISSIAPLLERLAARSLVIVEHLNGGAHYRLLETVREYALERLEASEEATDIRRRHAAFTFHLAELAPPESLNAAPAAVLESEQEEVRAVLADAVNQQEVELGLRLATGANSLWYFRGHYTEARDWLERVLALPEADSTRWGARAPLSLGQLLLQQGEYGGAEAASRVALDGSTAAADGLGIALATRLLGNVALWRGDLAQAGTLLGEAARRLRQLANPGEFGALLNYATVALEFGELDWALELSADIEERGQAWQPQLASAWGLFLRGSVAARNGDAALAEELFAQAFERQKPLAYHQFGVVLLTELGHTLLDQAKVDRARTAFAETAQAAYDAGLRIRFSRALDGIARRLAASQPADAIRLAAAAAGLRSTLGVIPWPRELRRSTVWLSAARRKLGVRAYEAAWSRGETLTMDEATDLARASLDRPSAVPEQDASLLTRREIEVATLLARGLSTGEIAAELVISVATVRVHVDHIMAKLDLHSRTQVAVWVREHAAAIALTTSPARD